MGEEGVVGGGDAAAVLRRVEDRAGLDGLAGCARAREALREIAELKRDVFRRLAGRLGPDAVLASTSSTISPARLVDAVERPERFLVAHWLNPAHIIPLVEVVPSARTSAGVVARTLAILERLRKGPGRCRDSPGVIGPRGPALLLNEALRLLAERRAAPQDRDRALTA